MTYSFTTTGAFGKVATEEITVNNLGQIQLIKEFMLAIAPGITESSLRMDRDPKQNAEVAMRWAMHLSATYEAFRQIAEKELTEESIQGPGDAAAGIQQGPPGVSAPPSAVHDLRRSGH